MSLRQQVIRGGGAGLVATGPMTVVIFAARRARLLRTSPPEEISARGLAKLPAPVEAVTSGRPWWRVAHGGYGVLCGVVYRLLRSRLPPQTAQAGLLFGGFVWGVSYLGLMPALDLYPWPEEDASPRLVVMIAAHAVYGVTLAALVQGLDAECFAMNDRFLLNHREGVFPMRSIGHA